LRAISLPIRPSPTKPMLVPASVRTGLACGKVGTPFDGGFSQTVDIKAMPDEFEQAQLFL
jgi:hypothetical protein